MQRDMHYYATYAMARLAGVPQPDAATIAQAAQWVDDQNSENIDPYPDGATVIATPTAHHPVDAGVRAWIDGEAEKIGLDMEAIKARDDARQVWVPFHFLPAAIGSTYAERMVCGKDSEVAREMIAHYLASSLSRNGFGLHLAGIAAHVYADTFSHYGFSGYRSDKNSVNAESLKFSNLNDNLEKELRDKYHGFLRNVFNVPE